MKLKIKIEKKGKTDQNTIKSAEMRRKLHKELHYKHFLLRARR